MDRRFCTYKGWSEDFRWSSYVVTKDVGPYEIWAGNPARIIRKRFDEHTIQELLKSKWFTLSDEKIDNLAIDINKPDLFMERINK